MSFNLQYYPKLKEAIEKDNLVIFVGAGTSMNLNNIKGEKIGTWKNLVFKLINHLNENSNNKYSYLIPLIEKYEPIEILNLIEKDKEIDKTDIYDFLKDFLDIGDNDYELHKKIIELSRIIITTNYDDAFENCSKELRKRVAYKGKNFELVNLKKNDKSLLFKVHGCYKDSDSMILFPSNYYDLYNNQDNRNSLHTLTAFKNLIYNKSILFIGCGMGDFQINHIFNEIKILQNGYNDNHFIITRNKPDISLNFLTDILIEDFGDIIPILDTLVKFKVENEKKKDSEKLEHIKEIELLNKKLEEKNSINKKIINELFDEATDSYNDKDYNSAIRKYQQISYLEELSYIYNNWGNAINKNSSGLEKVEVEKYLFEAIKKYKKAIKLDSEYSISYNNLGLTFYNLAKNDNSNLNYLLECKKNLEKAVKIDPNYIKALTNLGAVLFEISKHYKDENKINYLLESSKHYESLYNLDNTNTNNLYNWGSNFLELIKLNDFNQQKYINTGIDLFSKCQILGGRVYNFSCLYAIINRKDEALTYLKIALENKEINVQFVREDEDWIFYRNNDKDFNELLLSY